ncbi:ankyrin repeat-containing domain protein [Aspergillus multicolor]|uniref:ankyrin repeat domain-containing protein n=1 Tax=Aspergillus multicolor TaxID=41759 RepID=UPI003CCDEB4F
MVEFLIARGLDVNSRRLDGETVCTRICRSPKHERVSQLLISAGADVNALVNGFSHMFTCAARGDAETMALLFRRGMNPSLAGKSGWTALHFAARPIRVNVKYDYAWDFDTSRRSRLGVVKILVRAGADVNSMTDKGKTPLGLLKSIEKRRILSTDETLIVQYVKEHGAVIRKHGTVGAVA